MSLIVIMPARNEENYIADSINSILNQKVKPDKIIIVLDRCSDKTESIVDNYSRENNEIIKVVKNQTKYKDSFMKGFIVAETVNEGLKHLKSLPEFLMIANADSVYSDNYIQSGMDILKKDSKCGLVGFSHYYNISGSGYIVRSKILVNLDNRLKECAAEDTYLQFSAMNQGYSVKQIENVEVKLLKERGKGKIIDKIRYAFAKGYGAYTLGYSFYYEVLRTGYWILKGKFSHVGIIFGFIYGYFSKSEKLDIAHTPIPKKWQKQRLRSVFST